MDHEVTLMNQDLVLTQTMNANEQQIVTIDPEVALLHEDLPPVQTMIQNDNDTLTLHIPDWYIEIMSSHQHENRIHNDISKQCWLTDDLQEEIRSYYPSRDEILINQAMSDCVRDLDAFEKKCSQLFPVGRVFLSKLQFDQAAKHFLDGWNCKKVHHGKKIRCFFSVGEKKAINQHVIHRDVG